MSSPTFVIETRYRGRVTLYHVDLYRVEKVDTELAQQLEEDLYSEGVAAVEWAERLPPDLAEGATEVRFEVERGNGRRVTISTAEERIARAAAAAL